MILGAQIHVIESERLLAIGQRELRILSAAEQAHRILPHLALGHTYCGAVGHAVVVVVAVVIVVVVVVEHTAVRIIRVELILVEGIMVRLDALSSRVGVGHDGRDK